MENILCTLTNKTHFLLQIRSFPVKTSCFSNPCAVNTFGIFYCSDLMFCFWIHTQNLLNHKIIIELLSNRFGISYGHCFCVFLCVVNFIFDLHKCFGIAWKSYPAWLLMRKPIKRMKYWTIDLIHFSFKTTLFHFRIKLCVLLMI